MNTEIAHIINDYGVAHHGTKVSSDIIRAEFEAILRFFTLFQPDDLYACVLANHIKQLSASINYPSIEPLFPFLNSKKYKVFSIIFTIKESKMDAGYISRN